MFLAGRSFDTNISQGTDVPSSLLPNLGYPTRLIKASTNEAVLDEFRINVHAVLWRDPLEASISRYVHELRTNPIYQQRMQDINAMLFDIKFMPDGHIQIRGKDFDAAKLCRLNAWKQDNYVSLADLFPEPEAAAFRASLEALAFRARRVLHRPNETHPLEYELRINTALRSTFTTGHVDPNLTLGKSYTDPSTWMTYEEACEKAERHRGGFMAYINPDRARTWVLEPGDEAIITGPHGEGVYEEALYPDLKGVNLRVWAGVIATRAP